MPNGVMNIFIFNIELITSFTTLIYCFCLYFKPAVQLILICSKSTIETLKTGGVFIVNLEHISQLFPVFLLLTLNKLMFAGWVVTLKHQIRS